MLSDELVNHEQMSNWVGVKQLPGSIVLYFVVLGLNWWWLLSTSFLCFLIYRKICLFRCFWTHLEHRAKKRLFWNGISAMCSLPCGWGSTGQTTTNKAGKMARRMSSWNLHIKHWFWWKIWKKYDIINTLAYQMYCGWKSPLATKRIWKNR